MTSVESVQPIQKTIQIDEDGYFKNGEMRIADADYGSFLLSHLRVDGIGRFLIDDPKEGLILAEAFDDPFVAKNISRDGSKWFAQMPYGFVQQLDLKKLTLDEWDRFHSRSPNNIPIVFSRAAQNEFFNLVDEFDDESVTIEGVRYETAPHLKPTETNVNSAAYWNSRYQENSSGWEMNEANPALVSLLPSLKLQPMRVLVLGAGSGNDAAYLASRGHHVTAVDFSDEALKRAEQKYSAQANLKFVKADVFSLPNDFDSNFDMVVEHTLYCAIDPLRREELVKVWRRCLTDTGFLFGLFFTIDRPHGPPYGSTEWELRQRLGKGFRPLYWMRLRQQSHLSRQGMETFIFAQKLSFGL